jgi:radical SAM protein with 4Fe4S-binding SPASM domain
MKPRIRRRYLARAPSIVRDILLRGRYDFTYDLLPMHVDGMSLRKRLNLLRGGLNLLYRRPRPWSWPHHLLIELTSYCDLRCPVCPTGTGTMHRRAAAVDMDLVRRLLEEVGPYLLTVSLWGWGEPLLHPDFAEAVRIVREHGAVPLISTNGQKLGDPRVVDELMREPPGYLIVAIDGLTDQTNSVYRVGAKLRPILEGVRKLAQLKRAAGRDLPVLNMRYIPMKHNQHELPRVRAFAAENGFDMLSIRSLSIVDTDDSTHREMVPAEEAYRAYDYSEGDRVRRSDFICQFACTFPTVLADGTVVACDQDYNAEHPYGRFGDDTSFGEIWWSERAAAVRRAIMKAPEKLAACRRCPYVDRPLNTCTVEQFDLRQETPAEAATAG